MSTYRASAVNTRTGRVSARRFESAELAAGNILMLMRAHGWRGDQGDAMAKLLDGKPVEYKRFEYRVSRVPDDE